MGTKKNNLGVRIAMAVIGIALTAVSVGLQKISGLGVDPFSVIIFGFSNAFHATYQTVYIVVCAVLLSIAFVFNRKLLGIADSLPSFRRLGTSLENESATWLYDRSRQKNIQRQKNTGYVSYLYSLSLYR